MAPINITFLVHDLAAMATTTARASSTALALPAAYVQNNDRKSVTRGDGNDVVYVLVFALDAAYASNVVGLADFVTNADDRRWQFADVDSDEDVDWTDATADQVPAQHETTKVSSLFYATATH